MRQDQPAEQARGDEGAGAMARWSAALLVAGLFALGAVSRAQSLGDSFKPVPGIAGAFELADEPRPLTAKGKPLDAAELLALVGKADGFGVLADGVSVFGLDYAHLGGRREPLRPLAADLSDWPKAPACPPDRVLIDPRTGRLRFSAGHDPGGFQSRTVARFRGTHGDNAIPHWRGSALFLSHWESAYHVWAYDVADPRQARRIGELPVANFAHGFVMLNSGLALMGTTAREGVYLLDLRDPAGMKVVKPLLPGNDWLAHAAPNYVAVWSGREGWREPKVYDVSRLPEEFPEVTASISTEVRRYLTGRLKTRRSDGAAWFRFGDETLALISATGKPTDWRIIREGRLPEGKGFQVKPLAPEQFALLYSTPDRRRLLQVAGVSKEKPTFHPPLQVPDQASSLPGCNPSHNYSPFSPAPIPTAAVRKCWLHLCL